MKKEETEKICKNCRNWKSEQSELDYDTFHGFCTCSEWKFKTVGTIDVRVFDRLNRSEKYMGTNHFESQSSIVPIGQVERSRYCLVTNKNFGCINHQPKRI